jgi:transposase
MKAHSVDLRTKIVESARIGMSTREAARRFGDNRSTVGRTLRRLDEGNSLWLSKGGSRLPSEAL